MRRRGSLAMSQLALHAFLLQHILVIGAALALDTHASRNAAATNGRAASKKESKGRISTDTTVQEREPARCSGVVPNSDYVGHDLYHVPPLNITKDADECCRKCLSDPRCFVWSYISAAGNVKDKPNFRRRCFLKTVEAARTQPHVGGYDTNHTSGVARAAPPTPIPAPPSPRPPPSPPLPPNPCPQCKVRVESWGPNAIRVRVAPPGRGIIDRLPSALLPQQYARLVTPLTISPRPGGPPATHGNLQVSIDDHGMHRFVRVSDGKLLLKEHNRSLGMGSTPSEMRAGFQFFSTELFGMGHNRAGGWYRPGMSAPGYVTPSMSVLPANGTRTLSLAYGEGGALNTLPWLMAATVNVTVEAGLFLNMPGLGSVSLTRNNGAGSHNTVVWNMAGAAQIDFLVCTWGAAVPVSERAPALLNSLVDWVGHAPPLPTRYAGYWHSKNRYKTQAELLSVARGFANRSVPVDVIVIDWNHWRLQGDWSFDNRSWPSPSEMTRELAAMGTEVMVSVWPFSQRGSKSYETLLQNNWTTVAISTGLPGSYDGRGLLVDATIPEARQYVWSLVKKGYYDHGIRVYWLDGSEPEAVIDVPQSCTPAARQTIWPDTRWKMGTMAEIGQMYDWFWPQTFFDGLKSEGEVDVVTLPRAGYAGSWRFGAAVWSGDTGSDYATLRFLVRAGLSAQLSGQAWWTTDIVLRPVETRQLAHASLAGFARAMSGGYTGGDPKSNAYRELIVRWMQYGLCCPLFRQHGLRSATAIWAYGQPAEQILGDIIRLRASLKPYIVGELNKTAAFGRPFNRPLWWDFPSDPRTWNIDDSFMVGDQYLAAPVLEQGARSRIVYLPAGSRWVHHYSRRSFVGGAAYNVTAPLNSFPLFKRVSKTDDSAAHWFARPAIPGLSKATSRTDKGLRLYPAALPMQQAYWNVSYNTWGGSVYNDSGTYHLFMSGIVGGGTLSSWSTNSEVARAVSSTAEGPYTLVQRVLPVFHHNPQLVKATDGTFLLFVIGQTYRRDIDNSHTRSRGNVFRTELHFSTSIEGPWTSLGCVINGSNPSPHVLENGTVVVAYKSKPNGLRIAVADHWRGPYNTISPPRTKPDSCCTTGSGSSECCGEILLSPQPYGHPYIEDFFLWYDTIAKRWAMLLHQYDFADKGLCPGGFAYSSGESPLSEWHLADTTNDCLYNDTIRMVDSSVLRADRQRPKFLFDVRGVPAYLFNGLDQHAQKGPTHTFSQRVLSWTPPYDSHMARRQQIKTDDDPCKAQVDINATRTFRRFPQPSLIPWPRTINTSAKYWNLANGSYICAGDGQPWHLAPVLAEELSIASKGALSLVPVRSGTACDGINLTLDATGPWLSLVVNHHGIALGGSSYEGLAAATTSLVQALEHSFDSDGGGPFNCTTVTMWRVPYLHVVDSAEFEYRGIDVDCARKLVSISSLKEMITLARYYKLNYVHLHLTDDQAFTFPSTRFPSLAAKSLYAYNLSQLAELRQYARVRGITILGECDMPGHATALTQNDPDNFAFPSAPHVPIVNFINATVVANIQAIFDEINAVLPSNVIAIGGDEVNFDKIENLPEVQAAIKAKQYRGAEDLYREFIATMRAFAVSRNKTLRCWEGFGPQAGQAGHKQINASKVVIPTENLQISMFDSVYYNPLQAARDGYSLINSATAPLYVNLGTTNQRLIYDWHPWLFGDLAYSGYTSWWELEGEDRAAVQGVQICGWGMSGQAQVDAMRKFAPAFSDRQHYPMAMRSFADFQERFTHADQRLALLIAAASDSVPLPHPPAPASPPAPAPSGGGSTFVTMKGACRDHTGGYGPRIETRNVLFSQCKARCESMGNRCDAFDINGSPPKEGTDPSVAWCGVWGSNITPADATVCLQGASFHNTTWTYYCTASCAMTGHNHDRVCRGNEESGSANNCFARPPLCN